MGRLWASLPLRLAALIAAFTISFLPHDSFAESPRYTTIDTPRFTLFVDQASNRSEDRAVFVQNVTGNAIEILNATLEEYRELFRMNPRNKIVLRFLSPAEFKRQTGAPAWTSAMFYRGEISIPLAPRRGINVLELKRAIRHELVHALVAELSGFRSPAWIDEGLAQILEGKVNPLLGPALREWIAHNQAMPLSWLREGFTTLDAKIVPAAYAQSLYATKLLIDRYGMAKVLRYLTELRSERDEEAAFVTAFNKPSRVFEEELDRAVRGWALTDQLDP